MAFRVDPWLVGVDGSIGTVCITSPGALIALPVQIPDP